MIMYKVSTPSPGVSTSLPDVFLDQSRQPSVGGAIELFGEA